MSGKNSGSARLDYRPELGELVRDLAHRGAVGAYMGTVGGQIYLRRPDGGIEWTTYPSEIEPAASADGPPTVTVTGAA
ncbi:hypothetical protein ABZW10_25695 [Kitasatospora sp. NPDC004723]|uniref:hypothetical protein n=1 Tax=Kitasatospora sp. NPDC004723 TaxID=3154288 RepID=UPI0033A23434